MTWRWAVSPSPFSCTEVFACFWKGNDKVEIHPLARLIPPMNSDEQEKLTQDIRVHGLLEPIVWPRAKKGGKGSPKNWGI